MAVQFCNICAIRDVGEAHGVKDSLAIQHRVHVGLCDLTSTFKVRINRALGTVRPCGRKICARRPAMPSLTDPGMWNEAYRVLATGTPSVMVQLLLFNTVMMVLWNMRRSRG